MKRSSTDDNDDYRLLEHHSKGSKMHSSGLSYAWDGYFGLSQFTWNLFFMFLVVLGMVGQNVTLPIWFASSPEKELDPYFVLTFAGSTFCFIFSVLTTIDICNGKTSIAECKFFTTKTFIIRCILIGFCNALNGIFLVFAAPPNRTPTFLQAILGTFNIAWTILFRAMILQKVPSILQFVWAIGVFIGLFLASAPSIFGMTKDSSFKSEAEGAWQIMWPVIFASSFAPAAIMNVIGEIVLKETSETSQIDDDDSHLVSKMRVNESVGNGSGNDDESNVNVWYYLTIQSIAQLMTFVACFWVDCIHNFGTPGVHTANDVWLSVKQDWRYFFGLDGADSSCTIRALVFVACYVLNYIGSSLMLRYTEGATWTAIVGALVTPIGAMFWFFFTITDGGKGDFEFQFNWEMCDVLIICGLVVMGPFIYLYNREASNKEQNNME